MTGPVVPPIDTSFITQLQVVLSSTTVDEFNTAFNALFASTAIFTLNGATVTRATYSAALQAQSVVGDDGNTTAAVTLLQSVIDSNSSSISPNVAGDFYQVTLTPKIPGPLIRLFSTNSVNFVVQNNPSLGGNGQVVAISHVTN